MNHKTKINALMIDSETTWRGGEGQLFLLMKGLVQNDVNVSLAAAPDAVITKRAETLGVRCLPLPISGGMDLAAVWMLRRILRENAFDIVHSHSSHAHSIAFMAHGASHIRRRRVGGRPMFVVSRRVDFPVAKNTLSAMKYRRGADVYLAISNGVRDVLVECGIKEERIRIVRSGIELEKFAHVKDNRYLLEEFNLAEDTPVIGNVAALAPHKSQVDFIRAAKRVSEEISSARFLIVGEGELRKKLEAEIRRQGMEDTMILTGFRRDVLEILSLFDCFVLSSYLEGLCTSIMDAQTAGIPVVATDTGGVPDLVDDGKTGLLVPPRQPDRLAEAITRMLQDDELRTSCVRAAKTKSKSYDYNMMVEGTMSAYRQTLGKTADVH